MALADAVAAAQRVVANAHALGQRFALNLGLYDEELWLDWCKVMREAAAYGQERGVKVVVKHHHGLNNTSLDLLAWIKQVNHPNFGVFVDPGNIVYYTGKDAVKQTSSPRTVPPRAIWNAKRARRRSATPRAHPATPRS